MRYGIKEVANVIFYDIATGKPVLPIESLKLSNIENAHESVYAQGGQGNPKRIGWDFSRTATVTLQDALLSMESFNMLTQADGLTSLETSYVDPDFGTDKIRMAEFMTLGAVGANIASAGTSTTLRILNVADSSAIVAVGGGGYTVTAGTTGKPAILSYTATLNSPQVVHVKSNAFPGYYKVVGDTFVRNAATGADEAFQFIIPKAKIQANFTITMQAEGDPSVFDMNLDVFKPDDGTDMIYLVKY